MTVRLSALVLALVALVSCGSPAQPSAAPPPVPTTPVAPAAVHPLTGMWIGTAQAVTCSGYYCSPWVPYPLPPKPFSISVIEQGGRLTALLDIDVWVHLQMELTGAPAADGSVVFSGSARPPQASRTGTSDMHRFEVRLNPATGLAGDFAYTLLWSLGPTDVTGRIVSAERNRGSPTEGCDGWTASGKGCFQGQWSGAFLVTAVERCEGGSLCTGGNVEIGADHRLQLTLAEVGEVLGGDALVWSRVPVTGRTQRATALLDGRVGPIACGYPGFDVTVVCFEVIENLSVSLDQYGRMVGTLRYSREGWNGSSGGTQYYSFAVTGELWNVVRTQ